MQLNCSVRWIITDWWGRRFKFGWFLRVGAPWTADLNVGWIEGAACGIVYKVGVSSLYFIPAILGETRIFAYAQTYDFFCIWGSSRSAGSDKIFSIKSWEIIWTLSKVFIRRSTVMLYFRVKVQYSAPTTIQFQRDYLLLKNLKASPQLTFKLA